MRVCRVQLESSQQFPPRKRAVDCNPFGSDEEIPKGTDSFGLVLEGAEVVEILFLVEFLTLIVKGLSLSCITLAGKIIYILLCDEVFKFLQNSQFRKPTLQSHGLA